jgi:hypothetical protein
MKSILFSSTILLVFSFTSCIECIEGVGEVTEERRTVEDYDVLYLNCSANVTVRQVGSEELNKIIVRAQENLLPFIQTQIDGKRLVLDVDGCIDPSDMLAIDVITNGLVKIVHNGSGSMETIGAIKTDDLRINLEGSGSINAKFKGDELDISHNGSGSIILIGDCNKLDLTLDGSGEVNALEMKANEVVINLDGSGDISAFALQGIEISLSGSGNVRYKGSPQDIKQSVDGSGKVQKLD